LLVIVVLDLSFVTKPFIVSEVDTLLTMLTVTRHLAFKNLCHVARDQSEGKLDKKER
jgi:hypothetical protein